MSAFGSEAPAGLRCCQRPRAGTFVAHVIGSVENPTSDAALQEKFSDLCGGILATGKMHRLADLCRAPEKLQDVGDIGPAAAA